MFFDNRFNYDFALGFGRFIRFICSTSQKYLGDFLLQKNPHDFVIGRISFQNRLDIFCRKLQFFACLCKLRALWKILEDEIFQRKKWIEYLLCFIKYRTKSPNNVVFSHHISKARRNDNKRTNFLFCLPADQKIYQSWTKRVTINRMFLRIVVYECARKLTKVGRKN